MDFILFIGIVVLFVWILCIQCDINLIKDRICEIQKNNFKNQILYTQKIQNNVVESKQENANEVVLQENSVAEPIAESVVTSVEEPIIETPLSIQEKTVVEKSSFEEKFFGNIFNKVGAVAILVALCILIKIISPFIIFTNEIKIAISFIFGLGMVFGAFKIQKDEKMKKFAEVLMGTGFGALFITIYCGAGFMNVFSTVTATILAILNIFAIYFIADKQKTTSSLVIGLIGGYLSPFFINHHISINFLFNYLLFINILSAIFVYRNQQKNVVNTVNLSLTSFLLLCYSFSNKFELYQIILLWAVYMVFDILCIWKNNSALNNSLKYINFSILSILGTCLFNRTEYGLFVIIVAIIYAFLGFGYLLKTKEKENGYFYSCIIATFIAIFCLNNKGSLYNIVFWLLEAFVIALVSFKYGFKKMFNFAVAIFSISLCNLFIIYEVYKMNYANAIFNSRILYFLPLIVFAFVVARLAKKYQECTKSDIFKFLGITLCYIYLIFEVNSVFTNTTYSVDVRRFLFPMMFFMYSFNFNLLLKNTQTKTLYLVAKDIVLWFGVFWLLFGELLSSNQAILPVTNLRLVAYGLLGANIFYELKNKNSEWKKYLAIIFGFLYVHFESVNIAKYVVSIDWIISVMWILYSGVISVIGIFKNIKVLKTAGIWFSLLTVARLFIYDFATLNMLYKLIAFITLGVVLLAVSYLYNKKK